MDLGRPTSHLRVRAVFFGGQPRLAQPPIGRSQRHPHRSVSAAYRKALPQSRAAQFKLAHPVDDDEDPEYGAVMPAWNTTIREAMAKEIETRCKAMVESGNLNEHALTMAAAFVIGKWSVRSARLYASTISTHLQRQFEDHANSQDKVIVAQAREIERLRHDLRIVTLQAETDRAEWSRWFDLLRQLSLQNPHLQ